MALEAFNAAMMSGESYVLRITSTGSSAVTRLGIKGDVMMAAKTNGVYFRWGKSDTTVSDGTAATQGMYLPAGAVIRVHIPDEATHIAILQDTGAGQLYLSPGAGI